MKLSIDQTTTLISDILSTAGFNPAHTEAITGTIMAGEIDGCRSHGVWRTLGIVRTLTEGKVVPDAQPAISDLSPAVLSVDAAGGFSPLAYQQALPEFISKTRRQGIAALAVRHCVHFSALWVEIEKLTDAGLVGMAYTPSHAWVAPTGGREPVFGTNPMAFGWPRQGHPPFIFDFATSAVARGEIELHRRIGTPLPEGWGVDRQGNSSSDAAEVLDHGAMLTFGGHKGSALAAMIELLAGPLIGDLTSTGSLAWDNGSKALPYHGELLIAINPAIFPGGDGPENQQRAEQMFDAIVGQGARLPSQRRYRNRQHSLEHGLEIPDSLYQELCQLLPAG